jgi:hypothetical protein
VTKALCGLFALAFGCGGSQSTIGDSSWSITDQSKVIFNGQAQRTTGQGSTSVKGSGVITATLGAQLSLSIQFPLPGQYTCNDPIEVVLNVPNDPSIPFADQTYKAGQLLTITAPNASCQLSVSDYPTAGGALHGSLTANLARSISTNGYDYASVQGGFDAYYQP